MRRFFTLITILLGLALAVAYIRIRKSPWAITHLQPHKDAPELPSGCYDVALSGNVDSICVVKHLREMYVYRNDTLQKVYRMALGDAPEGHKHFQGDEKTPEGLYYINDRNPNSSCHKNLGISYPSPKDRLYAQQYGKNAGGDIKIHGLPNGQGHIGHAHLLHDWTNGCIGITDDEIDELYKYTIIGSPIYIIP